MRARTRVRSKRNKEPELLWFGDELAKLRKRKDLTQENLAEASGYTRNYISLLEGGERSPSLTALLKLALPLGVRASDMIREVESRKAKDQ